MEKPNRRAMAEYFLPAGVAVLILILGLGTAAQAGFTKTTNPSKAKSDFMTRFDKDGDGRVSQAEFPGSPTLFKALDKNTDGFIDRTEQPRPLEKGRSGRPGRSGLAGRGRPDPIRDFDRDGDKRLSRSEFPGPPQDFTRFDKNKDSYLTASEMPKKPPRRRGSGRATGGRAGVRSGQARNPIRDFDRDGDNRLSKSEFPGPAAHFKCFDVNQDGFLTSEEMPPPPPSFMRDGTGPGNAQRTSTDQ